jgi:LysR family transcriptional regulator, regulator for bpeEF and oprC
MEDLSAIGTFVRVVEAKGFSAAAPALGMTPSGVSRAIARLEERLGVRLFHRSTRTLRLTDDGAAFYARCCQIMGDLAEATDALRDARGVPSGKLRVGASMAIGRTALLENVGEFEALYPGIRLEIAMRDTPYDLAEDGIDCAIRIGDPPDNGLITKRLGCLRNVILASPEYLARHGRPERVEDLKRHRCIGFISPHGRPYPWQVETSRGRTTIDVEPHMSVNDGESVLNAAANGLGLVQAPYFMAACLVERGVLEVVMSDTVCTGAPIWIVYPPRRQLSARVHAFIGWVEQLFARQNEPHVA